MQIDRLHFPLARPLRNGDGVRTSMHINMRFDSIADNVDASSLSRRETRFDSDNSMERVTRPPIYARARVGSRSRSRTLSRWSRRCTSAR